MKINIIKVQDEIRKLGTIMVAAGAVGFVLENKITALLAIVSVVSGILLIILGSISE
jgi:hypothetical protein